MRILNPPLAESLCNLASGTKTKFLIVSPWIKKDALNDILDQLKGDYISSVITVGNLDDFLAGSSDISAFEYLYDHGCDIRLVKNLHAKIYISDTEQAIVTSANCTKSGMWKNVEIGVLIEEPDLVDVLIKNFETWHKQGKKVDRKWLDEMSLLVGERQGDYSEIKSQRIIKSQVDKRFKGNRIKFSSTNQVQESTWTPLPDLYDWREAIRNWELAQKHTQYINDWIRFFEVAFNNIPEYARDKAWFGVHKDYISASIGNMLIALIKIDKTQVYLIVDKDWDIDFKSTKKNPLGLKVFTWRDIPMVIHDSELWDSNTRSFEKIWDSPQSRLYRLDYMARKKCVATFFDSNQVDIKRRLVPEIHKENYDFIDFISQYGELNKEGVKELSAKFPHDPPIENLARDLVESKHKAMEIACSIKLIKETETKFVFKLPTGVTGSIELFKESPLLRQGKFPKVRQEKSPEGLRIMATKTEFAEKAQSSGYPGVFAIIGGIICRYLATGNKKPFPGDRNRTKALTFDFLPN